MFCKSGYSTNFKGLKKQLYQFEFLKFNMLYDDIICTFWWFSISHKIQYICYLLYDWFRHIYYTSLSSGDKTRVLITVSSHLRNKCRHFQEFRCSMSFSMLLRFNKYCSVSLPLNVTTMHDQSKTTNFSHLPNI